MAKKPAFLFYSNDFYEGTRTMLPEERACYIDLMVYQHQHEYIPNNIKRIAMYCVGVSEATLKATLEAKFKLCEKGWYNERLQEVMNDYEEYTKDQSDNGMYGQFIKKLNKDKSIKNLTELKDFIKNEYTIKRLIEDIKINNNYEATLEALLKHRLSSRVESESEIIITNSSNNTNGEISKKIDSEFSEVPNVIKNKNKLFTFSEIITELKLEGTQKNLILAQYKTDSNTLNKYIDFFSVQYTPETETETFSLNEKRIHFKNFLKNNWGKLPQQQEQRPKIKIL